MAAIAKVTRNPYLNNLLNKKCREIQGLRVIFSKGAVKETIKALHEGLTIGTLIDQNTRIRTAASSSISSDCLFLAANLRRPSGVMPKLTTSR